MGHSDESCTCKAIKKIQHYNLAFSVIQNLQLLYLSIDSEALDRPLYEAVIDGYGIQQSTLEDIGTVIGTYILHEYAKYTFFST